jgi:hypothetical protein
VSCTARHRLSHACAATLTVVGLSCTALLLGGCGDGRVTDPSLTTPAIPTSFLEARYPADGVELGIPRNWSVTAEKAPMVAVFSSGPAIISLWRYPSTHAALTTTGELQGALKALLSAAQAKDPTLKVERTGISTVDGDGAVIIDGLEQIAGKLRRVRSEHVYVDGAELVLDAYAPVSLFSGVDHYVFSPVRKSLALLHGGRPAAAKAKASTSTSTSTSTTPSSTAT